MYYVQKPQVVTVTSRTCSFHERHPGCQFPGCTCCSGMSSRDKTADEMTPEETIKYLAALRGEDSDGRPLW